MRYRIKIVRGLGALLLGLLCAGPALAQSDTGPPGPWQVSMFGGYYSGSKPYLFRGDFHDYVEFGSSATFALRFGYDFSPKWGVELSWTEQRPDETFENHIPSFIRQLRMNNYDLDWNYYFLNNTCVRPYVSIGFGGSNTGSSFGGANFTITTGLGVKWFVTPKIGIRAEWRYRGTYGNVGTPKEPAAYCDPAGCYFYNGSWYYDYEFSGGLVYAF